MQIWRFHHLLMVASLRGAAPRRASAGAVGFHHLLMVASLRDEVLRRAGWPLEVSTIF